MPALLVASLAITVAIHPQFSDFDLQSLAMGALPLAFAAAAQTVVVIAGGIDLSIGSVMAVANVLAASTMEKASFSQSVLLAVAVLMTGRGHRGAERPDRRPVSYSRRGGDSDVRIHLGWHRASHP